MCVESAILMFLAGWPTFAVPPERILFFDNREEACSVDECGPFVPSFDGMFGLEIHPCGMGLSGLDVAWYRLIFYRCPCVMRGL